MTGRHSATKRRTSDVALLPVPPAHGAVNAYLANVVPARNASVERIKQT